MEDTEISFCNFIKIVGTEKYPWILTNDIFKLFKITNKNQQETCLKHIDYLNKKTIEDEIYVNKQGLKHIIINIKPVSLECIIFLLDIPFIKALNLNIGLETVAYSEDNKHILTIQNFFSKHQSTTNYFVDDIYVLDLYFSKLKIAVECTNYTQTEDEINREEYITELLNCKIVRFNPEDPYFNIINVIKEIHDLIVT